MQTFPVHLNVSSSVGKRAAHRKKMIFGFFSGSFVPIAIEIIIPCCIIYKMYRNLDAVLYYTKFAVYTIVISIVAIITIPVFLLKPRDVRNLM